MSRGRASFNASPKVVKVDRPFVYFIRDNETGLVGRVADPTAK